MDHATFNGTVVHALADVLEFQPQCELSGNTVTIEMGEVTFDVLSKLSEAFGTKSINVRSEQHSGGGCETCNFYYEVATITIDNVTRWPGVP